MCTYSTPGRVFRMGDEFPGGPEVREDVRSASSQSNWDGLQPPHKRVDWASNLDVGTWRWSIKNGDITSVGIFKFQEFFQSLEYPTIDTIYHWNIIGINIGYHKLEQSLDTQPYRVGTSCSQLLGGTMVISINHPNCTHLWLLMLGRSLLVPTQGLEPKKGPLVTRRISYGFINPDIF